MGVGTTGKVLLKCQANCHTEAILAALGLDWPDLFPADGDRKRKSEVVATYDYTDEDGRLLFQVVRFHPKEFRQRRPAQPGDPDAKEYDGRWWVWKLGDTCRVLYRLPDVLDAVKQRVPIWLVEGEKDVHALEARGEVATTWPGGAAQWRSEYAELLRGANVVLVPDMDPHKLGDRHSADEGRITKASPGAMVAWRIVEDLRKVGATVTTVLPAEGKDLSDHLAAGYGLNELVTDWMWREPRTDDRGRRWPATLVPTMPADEAQALYEELMELIRESGSALVEKDRADGAVKALAAEGVTVEVTPSDDDGIVWLTDVEARPVQWLWTGRVPFGKVTIFEGEPEQGKSMVTCDLVARVTRGTVMPDGDPLHGPRNALIVSAEDDYSDTIKPRLMAAGADLARVGSYPLRRDPKSGKVAPLTIPGDVNKLQRIIERHKFELVIIDPITAFLAEDVQTHNDASVRRALSPANLMAQETRAAIVLLRHLNKDSSKSAINRGGGSVAFSANSRAVWVFAPHPDDEDLHLMARTKNNLVAKGRTPALGYRIESRDTSVGEQPIAAWEAGTYDLTADDLLKHDARERAEARTEALEWLEQVLAMGPVPVAKLQEMADAEHLSWSTVKRAKNASEGRFIAERVRGEGGRTVGWQWRMVDPDERP